MTIQEIEARKKELAEKIKIAKTAEELEELRSEVEAINAEVPAENPPEETSPAKETPQEEAPKTDPVPEEPKAETQPAPQTPACGCNCEDERKLIRQSTENIVPFANIKEEKNMNKNLKYQPETRAWAKKCLGRNDFDEEEKRALGDAVTTTATTFVKSESDTQGINNGGLFIPKEVRLELLERIEQTSPFFRDIRKLNIAGNVDLPSLFEGDDANWYQELNCTTNEGVEFKNLQLTGWELAKDIVLTWKVEDMAVDGFIDFVIDELTQKMGTALINAVIYGTGNKQPTGAIYGADAVTDGDTPIDTIIATYKSLSEEDRRGAKAYVSTETKIAMIGYKDQNGNYPFLQGINGTDLFTVETEPFLKNYDIIVGNPRNYVLNEVTPLRVDWERTVKCRQTRYGAYGIYDGAPKTGSFAKGVYTPTASV